MSPSPDDVLVPIPGTRTQDMKSAHDQLSQGYQTSLKNAKIQKQHRAALVALGQLAAISDVFTLGTTASGTYQQSELQAVIDRLNEVIAKTNELIDAIDSVRSASSDNIVNL